MQNLDMCVLNTGYGILQVDVVKEAWLTLAKYREFVKEEDLETT